MTTRTLAGIALATGAACALGSSSGAMATDPDMRPTPKEIRVVLLNDLPRTNDDTGYGVNTYPWVQVRVGTALCWFPKSLGDPARKATAAGGSAQYLTGVNTASFTPCSPYAMPQFPKYQMYSFAIQEKGGTWDVLRKASGGTEQMLSWIAPLTPLSPDAGFLTAMPPTGTVFTSASGRTVCITGEGYWVPPMLGRNDELRLRVASECPAGRTASAVPGTVRVATRVGQPVTVALGAGGGNRWSEGRCTGARASAPRRIRGGAVGSVLERDAPGTGQCEFIYRGDDGTTSVTTVRVQARR